MQPSKHCPESELSRNTDSRSTWQNTSGQTKKKPRFSSLHFKRRRTRKRSIATTRMIYLGLGWPIFIIGTILAPTPIPFGVPIMIVGVFLLASGSRWVRHSVVTIRRRSPHVSESLNTLRHKMPKPIQRFLLRTDPALVKDTWSTKSQNSTEDPKH